MERLTLACGGVAVNSTEDIAEEMLGWAGQVSEVGLPLWTGRTNPERYTVTKAASGFKKENKNRKPSTNEAVEISASEFSFLKSNSKPVSPAAFVEVIGALSKGKRR